MKKFISVLLIVLLIAFSVVFASCSHKHKFEVWTYDESHHYMKCECGEVEEGTTSSHTFGNDYKTCIFCDYVAD